MIERKRDSLESSGSCTASQNFSALVKPPASLRSPALQRQPQLPPGRIPYRLALRLRRGSSTKSFRWRLVVFAMVSGLLIASYLVSFAFEGAWGKAMELVSVALVSQVSSWVAPLVNLIPSVTVARIIGGFGAVMTTGPIAVAASSMFVAFLASAGVSVAAKHKHKEAEKSKVVRVE